jgi:hypothetical protein
MLKPLLLAVLLAAFAPPSCADTLKNDADLRPFGDRVMAEVAEGDLDAAFAAMKPYIVVSEAEFDAAVLQSRAQRQQFQARYGRTLGFELIDEKRLGGSLVRLTYIEKTEKHALPWRLYFYKTQDGWVLNSFTWNDQLPALFSTP